MGQASVVGIPYGAEFAVRTKKREAKSESIQPTVAAYDSNSIDILQH